MMVLLLANIMTNFAQAENITSGSFSTKVINYTDNQSSNLGQKHKLRLENKFKINNDLQFVNQANINVTTFNRDINTIETYKKRDEIYSSLGENYLRIKSGNLFFQLGLQEIAWGEAFGINYADIINPKDNRITNFNEQSENRLPLFMGNLKYLYDNGSVQLIYSPLPKTNKQLPIDLFLPNNLNFSQINKEQFINQNFFDKNEYALKVNQSFEGIDLSASYFDYYDRNAFYEVQSINGSTLNLLEKTSKIKTSTFSMTKTIADFVLRSDLIYHQDKTYNYFENSILKNFKANELDFVMGIDTPTYNDFTFFLISSYKRNEKQKDNILLPNESLFITGKLNYSLKDEKTFELSLTREMKENGNALQTQFNYPVNNNLELKIGGEYYFGDNSSSFSKLKRINNTYIIFKNYFQI